MTCFSHRVHSIGGRIAAGLLALTLAVAGCDRPGEGEKTGAGAVSDPNEGAPADAAPVEEARDGAGGQSDDNARRGASDPTGAQPADGMTDASRARDAGDATGGPGGDGSADEGSPGEAPIDLDARLAELRSLRDAGAFSEAFRSARLLRGELRTGEQQRRLKPLLDELRRMDRQAPRLRQAFDRFVAGGEAGRVGERILRNGGEAATILLRRAVREAATDRAKAAASLLRDIDPAAAYGAIERRLERVEEAGARAAWVGRLAELPSRITDDAAGRYYEAMTKAAERGEGELRRAWIDAINAWAVRTGRTRAEPFDRAIGTDGAYEAIRQVVREALESDAPARAAWASEGLAAFVDMPRDGLALWLPSRREHLEVDDAGRVTRWVDASDHGRHADQPAAGEQPTLVDGDRITAVRFDGEDDEMAIRELHYDDENRQPAVTLMVVFKTEDEYGSLVDFDRSESFGVHINFGGGDSPGHISFNTTDASNETHDQYSRQPVDDGRWHVAFAVYDSGAGEKRIYIDGELSSRAEAHDGEPLGSGRKRYGFVGEGSEASDFNGDQNDNPFEGRLAEAAIWHRALEASTIRDLSRRRLAVEPDGASAAR